MIKVETLVLGFVSTNGYIISNDKQESILIDPSADARRIISQLEEKKLKPLAILLTHAHFDHIGAIDEIVNKYEIPVYLHEKEKIKLIDGKENLSLSHGVDFKVKTKPTILSDKKFSIGGFDIEYFNTPGHTIGGVSFLIEDCLMTGDTLFAGSIGRTDFPGGSMEQEIESIRMLISKLNPNTKVYPGHSPSTSLGEEARSNPYLQ